MNVNLYLTNYYHEIIKDNKFYILVFFDNNNGLVFKTYIEENELKEKYIKLLENGNDMILKKLRKEVLKWKHFWKYY